MTTGRPIEFDKEKVLRSVTAQFWSHGYEATSLHDILKVTGLSKSSLYQSFGGKHELFLMCLDGFIAELKEQLLTDLNNASTAMEFIESVLTAGAEEARKGTPKGCLIMNTAVEFAQNDPKISNHVARGIEGIKSVFLIALKRAQREGAVSPSSNIEQLASFLVSSTSGIKSMVKGGAPEKMAKDIVKVTMQAIR